MGSGWSLADALLWLEQCCLCIFRRRISDYSIYSGFLFVSVRTDAKVCGYLIVHFQGTLSKWKYDGDWYESRSRLVKNEKSYVLFESNEYLMQ